MKVDSTLIVISFKHFKKLKWTKYPENLKVPRIRNRRNRSILHDRSTSEQCRLKGTTTKLYKQTLDTLRDIWEVNNKMFFWQWFRNNRNNCKLHRCIWRQVGVKKGAYQQPTGILTMNESRPPPCGNSQKVSVRGTLPCANGLKTREITTKRRQIYKSVVVT